MKYLILVNRRFPYLNGETFLENEVAMLAASFDRIDIFPSNARISDARTRNVEAKNIFVHTSEKTSFRFRKVKYMGKAAKLFLTKSHEATFVKRLIDGYFTSASNDQADAIIKVLDRISFTNADSIFVYSYWFNVNAKVACILKEYLLKRHLKVVAFSRAHRFEIYEELSLFRFLPQRIAMLNRLDHVYPCSDNGTTYLQKRFSAYTEKFTTSYIGTKDHGIGMCSTDNTFRIVTCSRVSVVKRLHLIIAALNLLKDKQVNLTWIHLGAGELYEKVRTQAKRELSWMNVQMDGYIPNTEVYTYYKQNPVDLFINVSSSEGLPASIMEATSFGIPVIATAVGGTPEIVADGTSGYLLPVDFTIEELAETIRRFIFMSKEDYLQLRTSTRKLWETHFQAQQNYSMFLSQIATLKN